MKRMNLVLILFYIYGLKNLASSQYFTTFAPYMRKLDIIIGVLLLSFSLQTQSKETPNSQQARRVFNEVYQKVFGEQGSTLHYKVNIIGIFKTEGTIWTKGKKSKFIDQKYIAWNNDVTYYRYEKKKNTVTIFDAHSEKRDKYATKFKFVPDNYDYSIKDAEEGYYITLRAKKGVKGIKEARCLLDKKNLNPVSVRIKLGIFHTTIKISDFKSGGLSDDLFEFPHQQYRQCEFEDRRGE